MVREEIEQMEFEHFINYDGGVKIVCAKVNHNGNGRVRIFRTYEDGMVEVYEDDRFVQLPYDLATEVRIAIAKAKDTPIFNAHNGSGLL